MTEMSKKTYVRMSKACLRHLLRICKKNKWKIMENVMDVNWSRGWQMNFSFSNTGDIAREVSEQR